MTDFDFDELDKAVNTAIGSTDEIVPRDDSPALQVSRAESEPAQIQSAPAARRSSGRFMDVVHPSSDMRTRSTVDVPSRPPQPVALAEDTSGLLDEPDWKTPLESPFLPDAQVEKRPLGGSAPTGDSIGDAAGASLMLEEPDELRLEAPDELQLEAPDEIQEDKHTMPDPIDFAANTIVAEEVVEAPIIVDEPVSSELASDADLSQAAALDAEAYPVFETVEPVVKATPATPVTSEPDLDETPLGPVSITQQYKEKPAEATESGAIYDTENYHQPITAPVKKKSGAWVILWILLILAIGGGAGAAFYFFVLPKL